MARSTDNPWLHRFAVFTALCTGALIGVGGLVTSHGVGMAVPDWPTTYGYNMFLFPISQWVGGIFYEHTHRLVASFVGLLTTVLAVWLWARDSRPTLRWLGVASFFAVVFQGVLGGLRVVAYKDELGIFHAAIAQCFLLLVSGIALATSRWWTREAPSAAAREGTILCRFKSAVLGLTVLVLLQLVLGASMRHQHAGLAIPDFPLAYGQVWPPMDAAFLEGINRGRLDVREFLPITAGQVLLHMAHRITAVSILIAVLVLWFRARRAGGGGSFFARWTGCWAGLVLLQFVLGAWTVWSNKAADVATLHVVLGALTLVCGGLLVLVTRKFSVAALSDVVHAPASSPAPDIARRAAGIP